MLFTIVVSKVLLYPRILLNLVGSYHSIFVHPYPNVCGTQTGPHDIADNMAV
jgi:hypothetical protein